MTTITPTPTPAFRPLSGRVLVVGLILALIAVMAFLAFRAGDSTSAASTAAPVAADPGPAEEGTGFYSEEEILDQIAAEYEAGKTVMNGSDGQPVGYIQHTDFDTVEESAGIGINSGFNVYDVDSDDHVGYWFSGVGFVSIEDYDAGFDAGDLAAELHGDEYGELYDDSVRALELVALGDDRTVEESEELQAILDEHGVEFPK